MVYGVFRVIFLLVLTIPPRSGAGVGLDKMDYAYFWAQDRLAFLCKPFAFPQTLSRPTPLAGGMAMAFVDDLYLSLTARPSFLSLFWRP